MTDYVWSRPTANKRHRCDTCWRVILPKEDYWRCAGLDRGDAWTCKTCPHCYRVSSTWSKATGWYDEWATELILEWLEEAYPALYASLLAGWRYPDGELLPLPFTPQCYTCGVDIRDGQIWCESCDLRRIDRVTAQLEDISKELRNV